MLLQAELLHKDFSIQIHKIRERIAAGNNGSPIQTVAFTSIARGVGVSTVTANLAYSFCRSTTHEILIVKWNDASNGRSSDTDTNRTIHKTETKNLFVLNTSAGQCPNPGTGEYESTLLKIDSLKKRFPMIFFDMPPIPITPEALGFVSAMDLTIVVIPAGKVKWQALDSLNKNFKELNIENVGVILNKKKHYIPRFLYKWL